MAVPQRLDRCRRFFMRAPAAGRASAAPGSALNQMSSFNHSGEADRCAAQLQRSCHFWYWAAAPARKRERVCRAISMPIPSTSSTRDFHATRPTSTFSATGFASLRRGSTATAIFAGTYRRANGRGASCPGRVSHVSTLAISVCAKPAAAEVVGIAVGWFARDA
jgi:hypothetical protein